VFPFTLLFELFYACGLPFNALLLFRGQLSFTGKDSCDEIFI
jgi:hypothetical protein